MFFLFFFFYCGMGVVIYWDVFFFVLLNFVLSIVGCNNIYSIPAVILAFVLSISIVIWVGGGFFFLFSGLRVDYVAVMYSALVMRNHSLNAARSSSVRSID